MTFCVVNAACRKIRCCSGINTTRSSAPVTLEYRLLCLLVAQILESVIAPITCLIQLHGANAHCFFLKGSATAGGSFANLHLHRYHGAIKKLMTLPQGRSLHAAPAGTFRSCAPTRIKGATG